MRFALQSRNRAVRMGNHPHAITSIPIVAVNCTYQFSNVPRRDECCLASLFPAKATFAAARNLRRIIR
jgi:hypothetical protein